MKRRVLILLTALFFLFTSHGTHAETPRPFGGAHPTVKIIAYKKLFTGDVSPFASGSGTIITPGGLILTNHHVIFNNENQVRLDAFAVCLTFNVNVDPVCEYTARVVADDEARDLALLQLDRTDVFGRALPEALPFLNAQEGGGASEQEQNRVQVFGYPASGGETITITQGQISGFETFNGFKYFKTDTDFDHGSSGGTVLDRSGRFIGVPTYLRTYTENVGYFLDLHEATLWLTQHLKDPPTESSAADGWLKVKLKQVAESNRRLSYTHPIYPYFSFRMPTGWKVAINVSRDALLVYKKGSKDPIALNADLSFYQFAIGKTYLDRLHRDLDRMKKNYPDYKRDAAMLAGLPADLVSYTTLDQRHFDTYLPYGYAMLHLHYALPLDKSEAGAAEIKTILDSFRFTKEPEPEPTIAPEVVFEEPAVSITSQKDWRFQKHLGSQPEGLIAEAVQKDNFDGAMYLSYLPVAPADRSLSAKQRLEELIKKHGKNNFKLIYKKDDVVLDGVPGWLVTFEYEGDRNLEIHQQLQVHLDYGLYEAVFTYDDLSDSFQKELDTLRAILSSFRSRDPEKEQNLKGVYRLGSLTYPFDDLRYHRFSGAITRLFDKGVLKKQGRYFFPERPATRSELLKLAIDSKNNLEAERGGEKIELAFSAPERKRCRSQAPDLKNGSYLKYFCAATTREFVTVFSNHKLRPQDSVTVAEALAILLRVYKISVWSDPTGGTTEWYKPYLDKGFELELVPFGLFDPGHVLTQGELAYMIDVIYNQAR